MGLPPHHHRPPPALEAAAQPFNVPSLVGSQYATCTTHAGCAPTFRLDYSLLCNRRAGSAPFPRGHRFELLLVAGFTKRPRASSRKDGLIRMIQLPPLFKTFWMCFRRQTPTQIWMSCRGKTHRQSAKQPANLWRMQLVGGTAPPIGCTTEE